jgi:hypothetical protein
MRELISRSALDDEAREIVCAAYRGSSHRQAKFDAAMDARTGAPTRTSQRR